MTDSITPALYNNKPVEWLLGWFEGYFYRHPKELKALANATPEELTILRQEIIAGLKTQETIKLIKESAVQRFVRNFASIYQFCTGQPYKTDRKHFILAARLINDHGFDTLMEKAKILACYCKDARVWFAKDGFGSFTIETLSNRWNNLLPQQRLSPEEIKIMKYEEELKKWEAQDARLNKAA